MKKQTLAILTVAIALVCLVATPVMAQYPQNTPQPTYGNTPAAATGGYRTPPAATAPTTSQMQAPGSLMGGAPSLAAGTHPAQPRPVAGGVGLIDIAFIMENCPNFKNNMEELQGRIQSAALKFKADTEQLRTDAQLLSEEDPNSQTYSSKARNIAARQADLEVQRQLANNEFLVAEGKIYYGFFQRIQQEVARYSQQNQLVAVIQFQQTETNPDDPRNVMRKLNAPIVWHNTNVDITYPVLNAVNQPRQAIRPSLPTGR